MMQDIKRKNIYKSLIINWLSSVVVLFFLLNSHFVIAQKNAPITADEVKTLKKQEDKLWYVDKPPTIKEHKTEVAPVQSSYTLSPIVGQVFSVLAWVAIGLALIGMIYLIFQNLKGFDFKRAEKIGQLVSEETHIENAEQLNQIAYESQINRALELKNYRLAVRLYYLWTLQKLSQAGLIDFHAYKTNLDYCQEIHRNDLLPIFIQCTRNYDYIWFGNFDINQQTFGKVETTFKQILTKLV